MTGIPRFNEEVPLAVDDVGDTDVAIHWNPPKDIGGSELICYHIERRDTKHTSWVKVATVEPHIHSYMVQNLHPGCEYIFRIVAENIEGLSEPIYTKEIVQPGNPPG